MKFGVVIPAAGRGKRMKKEKNKMFIEIADHPVLAHTINIFYKFSKVDWIVVVAKENEIDICQEEIINKYGFDGVKIVNGGETRRESVFSGLQALPDFLDYVIIHDGARPFLRDSVLYKVSKTLVNHDAVIVAKKVKDTIKLINKKNHVKKTLNRKRLAAVSTPQAFNYNLIMEAHQRVGAEKKVYDDASLVELIDKDVKIIKDNEENIKLTTPFDLKFAEYIIKNRSENNESWTWL